MMKKLISTTLILSIIILAIPSQVFALTETKYASSHITGSFTNPNNAIGAADTVWAGQLNTNSSETSRWAMEDPSGSLSGTQTVSVWARKGSNGNTPTIALNLYENGVLVQSIVGNTNVTSTSGETISGTFDGSVITNAADVEIEVVMTAAGGSPSNRNSAQIDEIKWDVSYSSSNPPTVSTDFVGNVSPTTATIYGTKTGGENATQHGFAYSTDINLTTGVSTTTEGALSSDVEFSSNISSLSSNTTYYYRAYATGASGTGYGIRRSFYTGNSNITRLIRIFEGFIMKLVSSKIILMGN